MGSNLISWSSKKQRTFARSFTEVEYKLLADTAAELSWLQSLYGKMGIYLKEPPVIWCDNIVATYLAVNPITLKYIFILCVIKLRRMVYLCDMYLLQIK